MRCHDVGSDVNDTFAVARRSGASLTLRGDFFFVYKQYGLD